MRDPRFQVLAANFQSSQKTQDIKKNMIEQNQVSDSNLQSYMLIKGMGL